MDETRRQTGPSGGHFSAGAALWRLSPAAALGAGGLLGHSTLFAVATLREPLDYEAPADLPSIERTPRRLPVRSLALALAVHLSLLLLYMWSLGEAVHVVVEATPGGYIAHVGDDLAILRRPVGAGGVRVYAGPAEDLQVGPAGQAPAPAGADFLARLGRWLRLAGPQPQWTNLRVQTGNPLRTAGRYTVSADLLRGEGLQGLLLGVDRAGDGYLLSIRMDAPDVRWLAWSNGRIGPVLVTVPLRHLRPLAMLQRDLRTVLPSAIAAMLLGVLALLIYPLAVGLWAILPGRAWGEQALDGSLRPVYLDVLAGGMAVLGLVSSGVLASRIFGGIPHGLDSVAYLFQAKTFALGQLWASAPRHPRFFYETHLIRYHGHWFSKYPPGWPLILAAGVLLRVPWLVNSVLGAGCLTLVYLIGREVYGRLVALLATALALSSPFFLSLSSSYMSHMSTLLFVSAFAYVLIRWRRRREAHGGGWQPLLAGLLLGVAFDTRQLDTVAFALPFAVLVIDRPRAVARVLLGSAPPVLLLLLYNWALVGSVRVNLYTLLWKYDRLGFGPDVGASGFTPGQALWNMADRFETLHSTLFGWPFYLALAVVVLPFVLWCASRWDLLFAASTLSLMGAYFFFWWPGVTFGVRYWSAAIPWLALLAARGLVTLYDLPRRVFPELRPDRRAAATLPLAFGVVMVLYDLLIYLPAQAPVYRTYQYMSPDPLGVVQRAHLHHALVFVVVRPGRWSYGEVFADNAPSLAGNVVYARDLGSSDRTLMRLYPGRALYRLDNTVLTRLDEQAAARPGGYAPSRPAARRFSSAART